MSDSPTWPIGSPAPMLDAATGRDAPAASVAGKDDFIDAMRGFAALLVAYFHCRQVAWIGMHRFHDLVGFSLKPSAIVAWSTLPVAFGSAGVSLFFVISGYCIHRTTAFRLAADPRYRLDAGVFWARRFARIYPVLLAALLLTLAFDSVSLSLPPVNHKILDLGFGAFLVNLLSLQGVLGHTYGSNGALWTLSIEVQFYAAYPLVVAARRRLSMPAVMVGIAAINIVSALLLETRTISFFTSYWFSWMLGACIAEIRATSGTRTLARRQQLAWHAGGICAAAFGCIAFSASQYVAFQCWAIGFACILRAVPQASHVYASGGAARQSLLMPIMRPLARCGAFSYSLYAIHLPLFVCLQSLLFRSALQVSIWPSLAYMPLAILAAYVVYRCVERPAIRWSASIGRRGPPPSAALTPGQS